MSVSKDPLEDGTNSTFKEDVKEILQNLKQERAIQKSAFTRVKNTLLNVVDKKNVSSRKELRELYRQLSHVQERVID